MSKVGKRSQECGLYSNSSCMAYVGPSLRSSVSPADRVSTSWWRSVDGDSRRSVNRHISAQTVTSSATGAARHFDRTANMSADGSLRRSSWRRNSRQPRILLIYMIWIESLPVRHRLPFCNRRSLNYNKSVQSNLGTGRVAAGCSQQ